MKVVAAVYVDEVKRIFVVCEDGKVYVGKPTAGGVLGWQETKSVGGK